MIQVKSGSIKLAVACAQEPGVSGGRSDVYPRSICVIIHSVNVANDEEERGCWAACGRTDR